MKIKILSILFVGAFIFSACKATKYKDLENGIYADMETNKGTILLKLYAEDTPLTVGNFVSLAEGNNPKLPDSLKGKKYYDGIKFHRVIANFMIQGGDPTGTGSGNPGYKFGDEFPKDTTGNLKYKHNAVGVLSMANSGPYTNGSQFFITHKETPWLDGKHSIFGKVVKGQNVVDSIVQNDTILSVEIIRMGAKAKNFNAPKIFEEEFIKSEKLERKKLQGLEVIKKSFLDSMGFAKAIATKSGLKILSLKKGKGKKVTSSREVSAFYTLKTYYGKLIQSNEGKTPFKFIIDKVPFVAGWKEGLLTMREGDKVRLFIPYYLGYGERGNGPIPPKSDLVFDVEVLKVTK